MLFRSQQTAHYIDVCKNRILEQQKVVFLEEEKVRIARLHLNDAMKERKIYEKLKDD